MLSCWTAYDCVFLVIIGKGVLPASQANCFKYFILNFLALACRQPLSVDDHFEFSSATNVVINMT